MFALRYAFFGFACLVVVIVHSSGQSQEQPSEQQTKNQTTTEQRGTEQAPFIIKILPPENAEHKSSNAAAEKPEKTASNGTLSNWIAGIAAFAAVLQFIALVWTILALRRSTKIAERAYISGGGYFPSDPTTGWREHIFQLTIDNYGKTPAFVTHVNIVYWLLAEGAPPDPPPCRTRRYVLNAVLPPGKEGLKMDVKLRRDEMEGDVNFGRFFYEDIFAGHWFTKKRRIRSSGFILRIAEDRETLAIDAPRAYTRWD